MVEFLVVSRLRCHDAVIQESFPTEAEAEAHKGLLMMEPTDENVILWIEKVNPGRIRKRGSYKLLRDVAYFFQQDHSMQEILEYVYDTINACKGFGSETKAWYPKESLFYLLKDLQQEDGVDCFVCKVQSKVRELDESQLQEISDLCMSELDRREESVPSLKMEVRP